MGRVVPWIRTLMSMPAGVLTIELFHRLAAIVMPAVYASDLGNNPDRVGMLLLVVGAGISGCFAVAAIALHRLWLHMGLFLLIMLVIDIDVVLGALAAQPVWFKAAIFLTMPIQILVGANAAKLVFRKAYAGPAGAV